VRTHRPARTQAHLGVVALALLLLALPLLLGALALGTGGLPHEGLEAASTRDVSAAALDRIERYLSGDLSVALAALAVERREAPPGGRGGVAPESADAHVVSSPSSALTERRL
jgi:hypothetical protein